MKDFKDNKAHFDSMYKAGARMGFAKGGPVTKPMSSMDHGVQPAKPDGDSQQAKEAGGTPRLRPGYAKGGQISQLRDQIKNIERRRATTVGHNRRARMDAQIGKIKEEIEALEAGKEKKACGGRMKANRGGRAFNGTPLVGK